MKKEVYLWMLLGMLSGTQGLTCLDCTEVQSANQCQTTRTCGPQEICYTRTNKDNKGNQTYQLGCENKDTCVQLHSPVFGKRGLSERVPPGQCYDCCSTDECNCKLCLGDSGGHSQTLTTSLSPPTTESSKGCRAEFIAYHGKCYMFNSNDNTYKSHRSYCQRRGADLLVINSKEENDFITKEIENGPGVAGYWIGGVYSQTYDQWYWLDGSAFNYTNWNHKYPLPTYRYDAKLVIVHKSVKWDLQAGEWVSAPSNPLTHDAAICEMHQLAVEQ